MSETNLAERMQKQVTGLAQELESMVRGTYQVQEIEQKAEALKQHYKSAGNGGGMPPNSTDRQYSGKNPGKKGKASDATPGKWGRRAKNAVYATIVAGAFALGAIADSYFRDDATAVANEVMKRTTNAYHAVIGKDDLQNTTVEYNGGN